MPDNVCIIIPHYNHSIALAKVINEVSRFNLQIILVDDGSNKEHLGRLNEILSSSDNIKLLTHRMNQGKGAALRSALLEAQRMNFSCAIQVDADAQHDCSDIVKVLAIFNSYPEHLILGNPTFGADAPLIRVWGRKLSNILIKLECNTRDPERVNFKDCLCGFRAYPVKSTVALLNQYKFHDRMGFDLEIIVRLVRSGVKVTSFETNVSYPVDGVSHYRYIQDNLAMIRLHTRLILERLGLQLESNLVFNRK